MDIPINAKVSCSDGPFGRSTSVILRPTNAEITHFVVSDESFPKTEYLVPIDQIYESTPDQIMLKSTRSELIQMPLFNKLEFIPSTLPRYSGGPVMMWPFSSPMDSGVKIEKENIPVDALVIKRGSKVEAMDGHVGAVDEFLINPENEITHLILREGHLWGKRDVTIPVNQIDHYSDNTVYLKMNKEEIERLPNVPIRHLT
jgi:hypothetical protein